MSGYTKREELRERLNDAYTDFHKTTEDKTIRLAVLRIVDIATEALRLARVEASPPRGEDELRESQLERRRERADEDERRIDERRLG